MTSALHAERRECNPRLQEQQTREQQETKNTKTTQTKKQPVLELEPRISCSLDTKKLHSTRKNHRTIAGREFVYRITPVFCGTPHTYTHVHTCHTPTTTTTRTQVLPGLEPGLHKYHDLDSPRKRSFFVSSHHNTNALLLHTTCARAFDCAIRELA